ncbi:hypothetical protein P280DRAFT_238349 [Massarina eburnea CBS 473.64]|uniref:Uncharacterized protein n=1 Tax=Massarina eburnea CBS 473.64 TaxID=1395130 RepID=A0A6A6RH39_9PLEO|nr:hypothetical protein P280DRAFT_238349 [Massarina eburnea CBS 473.64]
MSPLTNMERFLFFLVKGILLSFARSHFIPRDNATPTPSYNDPGPDIGSVHIQNSCDETFLAVSVGAWPNATDKSGAEFQIAAHGEYQEPFRETVYMSREEEASKYGGVGGHYDPISGKMFNQGISIKFTTAPQNYSSKTLQLEYALIKNTVRGDNFLRINYDVSLLDCAVPPKEQKKMTDVQSSQELEWNQKKIDGCPGYQKGFAMWFDDSSNCRPIYCDGQSFCDGVYNYDKSRVNESSFECSKEYRGILHFELCAGNGNGTGKAVYEKWAGSPNKPGAPSDAPKASQSKSSLPNPPIQTSTSKPPSKPSDALKPSQSENPSPGPSLSTSAPKLHSPPLTSPAVSTIATKTPKPSVEHLENNHAV